MKLSLINETIDFNDAYRVFVSGFQDHPALTIPGVGFIRLFYSSSPNPHYSVHMITGDIRGAGTVLYFAALDWVIRYGIKDANGLLASDLTVSPRALKTRAGFERRYADYIYKFEHPNLDAVKVHRGDNTDWRRSATSEEVSMWRLKKEAPFEFRYT